MRKPVFFPANLFVRDLGNELFFRESVWNGFHFSGEVSTGCKSGCDTLQMPFATGEPGRSVIASNKILSWRR